MNFQHELCFSGVKYWIGCNDISNEGTFVWSHNNERISYSNWAINEPANQGGNEDCCMIGWDDQPYGKWNDKECDYSFRFICKKLGK